jgi:hypothetical protein
MRVLLAVAFVLIVCVLFATDRAIKAVNRGRRRRETNERLVAAAAVAEEKERERRENVDTEEALTSIIPTIHDHEIRNVD